MPELGRLADDQGLGNFQRGLIVDSIEPVPATDNILVSGKQIEVVVFRHQAPPGSFDYATNFFNVIIYLADVAGMQNARQTNNATAVLY